MLHIAKLWFKSHQNSTIQANCKVSYGTKKIGSLIWFFESQEEIKIYCEKSVTNT